MEGWVWLSLLLLGLYVVLVVFGKYKLRNHQQFWKKKPQQSVGVLKRLTRPVHVSHRGGGSAFGPENTLYTFKKCIAEGGTQAIELDVHLTKDEELVIMHNTTVDETTDGQGYVKDKTLAELNKLDAGYHYTVDGGATFPLRGKGITIPTLREFLDEFIPVKDLVFFFDLKSRAAIHPLVEIIQKEKLNDRVILGAVSYDINQNMLKHKPADVPAGVDIRTMVLVCLLYNLGLLPFYTCRHDIFGFYVASNTDKYLGTGIFSTLSKMGCWTAVFGPLLDEEEIQRRYIDLGADMILTDRPEVLRHVLSKQEDKSKGNKQKAE